MALNTITETRAPVLYRFRTDDLDEAREFMRRRFGNHTRVPSMRGPLGLELSVCVGLQSLSGTQSLAVPSTVRTVTRSVTVHLPTRRGAAYRVGRRSLHSAENVAVLLAPGHDYSVASVADTVSAVMLDAGLLASEIDDRSLLTAGTWSLQSVELPLLPEQRAEFMELVGQHQRCVGLAERSRDHAALVQTERRIAGWLAGRLEQCGALRPLSVSSRRAAELVEAWIRDHATQPVTLEQLAAVAGVSARTLQKACLARWGQTPLELVASRRIELVRSGLSSQPGALSVTEAAVRAGFTHLGRFAALYRRAYGESPSDTLARSRLAPGGAAQG